MMKLCLPAHSARKAAWLAVVTRIFCGLTVSAGSPHNGAWIAALLGAALAVPLTGYMDGASRRPAYTGLRGRRAQCAALSIALLADTAWALGLLSGSASFLSAENSVLLRSLLPAALALTWVTGRNGDAVGYGAALWLKLLPPLLLLVMLLHLPHLRPDWLFPLLGDGPSALLPAALRSAGWAAASFSAADLLGETASPPASHSHRCGVMSASAVSAALILFRLMMTPEMPAVLGGQWLNRLDTLLTNGRAPLYGQLPMIVLWFTCLMNLLAFDGFAAAALIQRFLPRMDGRLLGALTAAAASAAVLAGGPALREALEWIPAAALAAVLPFTLMKREASAHG